MLSTQHLNELDGNRQAEVVAVMKAVVATCRALSHSSYDSHAHYTRSFESILQTCFAQVPLLGMTMESHTGAYGQVPDPLDNGLHQQQATSMAHSMAPQHVCHRPSSLNPSLTDSILSQMPMDEIWRDFMPGLGNHLLGVRCALPHRHLQPLRRSSLTFDVPVVRCCFSASREWSGAVVIVSVIHL